MSDSMVIMNIKFAVNQIIPLILRNHDCAVIGAKRIIERSGITMNQYFLSTDLLTHISKMANVISMMILSIMNNPILFPLVTR